MASPEDTGGSSNKRTGSIRGLRSSLSTQSFRTAFKLNFKGGTGNPGNAPVHEEELENDILKDEESNKPRENSKSASRSHIRSKSNSVSVSDHKGLCPIDTRLSRSASVSGPKYHHQRQQKTTQKKRASVSSETPSWPMIKNQVIGGMKEPFSLREGVPVQWISSLNISWSR